MLGVEVSAAQTVLNGQAAVAVAQVVELGAKDHRLRGVAGAGQRVVKFPVFPIPFVAQSLSVTLRAPSQPMGGGNDLPLPAPVASGNRSTQSNAFNPRP